MCDMSNLPAVTRVFLSNVTACCLVRTRSKQDLTITECCLPDMTCLNVCTSHGTHVFAANKSVTLLQYSCTTMTRKFG